MSDNEVALEKQATSSEILLYQTEDGKSKVEVRLENEMVWLSQKMLSELFQVSVSTINEHIKHIFKEGELHEEAVIRNFRITASDNKTYLTNFYNLDMIMAIGYRVRSHRGVQFRQWATERLREYMIKGFVLDDERLKEGRTMTRDYFDELLERIRDIRASEKRFYQKIREIYKLAIDYDPHAEETIEFFKIVQNKLHWAITGKTAAELIAERADAEKPNMGLTTWTGEKFRKSDVTIAKNYLNEEELRQLNRIVTMYLDYAEMQAEQRQPIYMKQWKEKLDAFLKFNEKDILTNAGKVSMEVAKKLAIKEYEQFHRQRLQDGQDENDEAFEQMAKDIEKINK